MTFIDILRQHHDELLKHDGGQLNQEQRRGIKAMLSCRQNTDRVSRWHCNSCDENTEAPLSCGHRHCPQCQHHTTSEWLARQQRKLLPVNYFMVTFTVPYELRALIKANAKRVYPMLFKVAASVLKDFAARKKALQGQIGFTGVLHTHSRQREYHPHLHFIIPAGSYHWTTGQWHKLKGKYLFNVHNLANVWRARLLEMLKRTLSLTLPAGMNKAWVVHCVKVGQGAPALKYLSRYLYRGVLPDKAIVKV
ncbi:transposase zinc-binding domain-containing protein, partial [Paraferrimonas sp. SM1919]|uniref:IS91 family transposase n=1 Tax=Paraferrimonas sp. SM1919 TaxID=2662263 RepID=UPI0013D46A3B